MNSKHLITAISLAAISSTTTLAFAQPGAVKSDKQNWHRLPQVQPLLAYLRCEEVPLDQFGEAEKPTPALMFLMEILVLKQSHVLGHTQMLVVILLQLLK